MVPDAPSLVMKGDVIRGAVIGIVAASLLVLVAQVYPFEHLRVQGVRVVNQSNHNVCRHAGWTR